MAKSKNPWYKKEKTIFLSIIINLILFIIILYLLFAGKFDVRFTATEFFLAVLNIVLFIWGVIQLRDFQNQEKALKNKVRLWHKHIEGIKNALLQLSQNPQSFNDKTDIASAINMVAQSASSLDDSFAEDRFYSDEEIKSRREENEKQFKKMLNKFKTPANS